MKTKGTRFLAFSLSVLAFLLALSAGAQTRPGTGGGTNITYSTNLSLNIIGSNTVAAGANVVVTTNVTASNVVFTVNANASGSPTNATLTNLVSNPYKGYTNGATVAAGANVTVATNGTGPIVYTVSSTGVSSTNDVIQITEGYFLTDIIYISTASISNLTNTGNIYIQPPLSAVQYNSNGVMRGSGKLLFTNNDSLLIDANIVIRGTNHITWSNGISLAVSPTNNALYLWNTNGDEFGSPAPMFLLYDDAAGVGLQAGGAGYLNAVTSYSNLIALATMQMRAIRLTNGAFNGGVLTSDANGLASWQTLGSSSGAGTNISIAVGQTLYLDAAFGNDATASRTNLLRPYLTVSNAIAAMQSGDTLVVRGGTSLITPHPDPINTPFGNVSGGIMLSNLSNLKIVGQAGSIWKMSSFYSNSLTYSCPMLDLVRCTNVVIDGLTMVGIRTNALVAQHYAVRLAACQNVTFRGVTISNWQNQGITDANETTFNREIRVLDCLFTDIGGTNCYSLIADGTAVSVNASNIVVSGNRFYNNLRDCEIYSNGDVRKFVFEGNLSEGCYNTSLAFLSTNLSESRIVNNIAVGYATNPAPVASWMTIRSGSNVVVQGNQVSGFYGGINYQPVAGSLFEDVEIWDNVFQDFTEVPITIHPYTGSTKAKRISIMRNKFKQTTFSAIWLGGANNSRVEHNEMVDCNTTLQPAGVIKIGYPDNTYTNGTNISIVGNKIYTSDMAASASTGIVIYASSYSNSVWGNDISRRYQGSIHDLGSGTMTQPLNKMGPGKLLYSDTNSRLAEVTIGSGIGFDGSTGTLTGSGGGSSVAAPFSSVQYNSNGVMQGNYAFRYTNGVVIATNFLDIGNVKYWGSKGDGVTDDTVAIQAAITYAQTAGGSLFFPSGTYILSSTLTVASNNVRFEGVGKTSSILRWTTIGSGVTGLAITGSGCSLMDLRFIGPGAAGTYTSEERIVSVNGTKANRLNRINIERCDFQGSGSYGLRVDFVDHALVSYCTVSNCAYSAIMFSSCNNGNCDNNRVDMLTSVGTSGNAYGISFSHDSTNYSLDPNVGTPQATNAFCNAFSVTGNSVRGPKLWQAIDTHGCYNFRISGNYTYAAKFGISVTSGSGDAANYAGYGNTVVGNVIDVRDMDGTAVGVVGTMGLTLQGGSATNHDGFTAVGNIIRGYGTNFGASIYASLGARRFVIADNVIQQWYGYGIFIQGASSGGVISGNVFGDVCTAITEDGGGLTTASCIYVDGTGFGMVVNANVHLPVTYRARYGIHVAGTIPNRAITSSGNDFVRCLSFVSATDGQIVTTEFSRFGIGTTNPLSSLHIAGSNRAIGVGYTDYGNLFIGTTNANAIDQGGELAFGATAGVGSILPYAKIHGKKSAATDNDLGGYLAFETGNNFTAPYSFERVRITSSGDFGIGTRAPSSSLDVTGQVRAASAILTNGITINAKAVAIGNVLVAGSTNGTAMYTNALNVTTLNAQDINLTNALGSNQVRMGLQDLTNVVAAAPANGDVLSWNSTMKKWTNVVNSGSFSVSGNSNQIPYVSLAGNAYLYGSTTKTNPGFGYSTSANSGLGALMVGVDNGEDVGYVQIGKANNGSQPVIFTPSLSISNTYAYSGSGSKVTQAMVRVTFVDQSDGSDPESFIQQWNHADAGNPVQLVAGVRRDGQILAGHGTYYPSNSLASTFPTAAQLGLGGYWVGVSNGPPATLVAKYSLDGVTVLTKVLAP